jgi:small subunit ribosomal protein S15
MSAADNVDVTKLETPEIVKMFGNGANDTGAPEVQIALLTKEIEKASAHVKLFVMDRHSQRGMMAKISRRKRLLSYLKKDNVDRYRKLIGTLGLRK